MTKPGTPNYGYSDRDAWYRSPLWDQAAQAAWATKIARARPHNQFQYRRIKGLALIESGDPVREEVGRQMLRFVIDAAEADEFERTSTMSILGHFEARKGNFDVAEQLLRRLLAEAGPEASGTSGEEEIVLAEILIAKGSSAALSEARALLDGRDPESSIWPTSNFRHAAAQAKVSMALGELSAAREWAGRALEFADLTDSGLRYHANLGLVEADPALIAWLRKVAHD